MVMDGWTEAMEVSEAVTDTQTQTRQERRGEQRHTRDTDRQERRGDERGENPSLLFPTAVFCLSLFVWPCKLNHCIEQGLVTRGLKCEVRRHVTRALASPVLHPRRAGHHVFCSSTASTRISCSVQSCTVRARTHMHLNGKYKHAQVRTALLLLLVLGVYSVGGEEREQKGETA